MGLVHCLQVTASDYLPTFMSPQCQGLTDFKLLFIHSQLLQNKWSDPRRLQTSCSVSSSLWPRRLLPDNTAWILTRRGGWSQQDQTIFYLPIFISDGEQPVQTSTSTLTIRVCSCDQKGNVMSCNAEAYSLPASLSRGALIAILACIFVLLGELWPDAVRTSREEPEACCHRMMVNLMQCQLKLHVTAELLSSFAAQIRLKR